MLCSCYRLLKMRCIYLLRKGNSNYEIVPRSEIGSTINAIPSLNSPTQHGSISLSSYSWKINKDLKNIDGVWNEYLNIQSLLEKPIINLCPEDVSDTDNSIKILYEVGSDSFFLLSKYSST